MLQQETDVDMDTSTQTLLIPVKVIRSVSTGV